MPTDPLTHPHLRTLLADAEATRAGAERLGTTLSEGQLTWKPAPDVWSVADCFEHLRKTDALYCALLPDALGRAKPGSGPYRPSWFNGKFIDFASPGSSFKLPAPKAFRPVSTGPSAPPDALDGFLDQQAIVLDLLRRADGRNLNTGRFPSPVLSLLRFSVGEGLTLIVRHEQRHLGQASRLTERADFPRA